jgi:beta-lactamase-like protein
MEIAPGIHNVITEPAPAPGVTNTYLIIYSGLNERLSHLARNQIRSHLIKLENEGRVSARGPTYHVTTSRSV